MKIKLNEIDTYFDQTNERACCCLSGKLRAWVKEETDDSIRETNSLSIFSPLYIGETIDNNI